MPIPKKLYEIKILSIDNNPPELIEWIKRDAEKDGVDLSKINLLGVTRVFYVSLPDGQPIGFVLGHIEGERGFLHYIAVAEEYRRQGIAKELMLNIYRYFKACGVETIMTLSKPGTLTYKWMEGWDTAYLIKTNNINQAIKELEGVK